MTYSKEQQREIRGAATKVGEILAKAAAGERPETVFAEAGAALSDLAGLLAYLRADMTDANGNEVDIEPDERGFRDLTQTTRSGLADIYTNAAFLYREAINAHWDQPRNRVMERA